MLNKIISYYRACYQSDFRTINLTSFFGSKVKHRLFLEDAELLEGRLENYPVSTEWAKATDKHLAIYAKEQRLYYCAFFVHGEVRLLGKKQEVFAPLYFYEADISWKEDIAYLTMKTDAPIINPAIVSCLKSSGMESRTYDVLSANLPKGPIGFTAMEKVEKVLAGLFPALDTSALKDYPTIQNQSAIEDIRGAAKGNIPFSILPAMGLAVIKKPATSRGILTELEQMAETPEFSNPVKSIFTSAKGSKAIKTSGDFMIPVTLSKSQHKVLESALKHDLTLVVGPPGTGKSFTIAALAVEFLTDGKSVLIASKNDQAVNVIANKIDSDFGLPEVVVNAANRNYKQALQTRLKNMLSGMLPESSRENLIVLQDKLKDISSTIARLEAEALIRETYEIKAGQTLYKHKLGTLEENKQARRYLSALGMANWRFFEQYFPIETIQKNLKKQVPLWKLMVELEEKNKQRNDCTKKLLAASFAYYLNHGLSKYRQIIQQLLKGLQARTGNKKEALFEAINFDKILEVLPIWAVSASDVHMALPLRKDLFDLVIIDEATQCDVASVLPILQRGKRAVIVGDPKQLRHLSFLSKEQQKLLKEQNDLAGVEYNDLLNYREKSILDVVSDKIPNQEQVQFLNEHYRSMPDIIRFSNQRFYGDNLTIMTASPDTLSNQYVFLYQTKGERYKTGYNKIEATTILEEVASIIKNEQFIDKHLSRSIGILSPFREQVNYIQKEINKRFSIREIEKHQLLVGTPFNFQGEEREVMLLSFVLDNEAHASAFRYLSREDVFNVSITRARSLQRVYISFETTKFRFNNLVFNYVDSLEEPVSLTQAAKEEVADVFMEEVVELLSDFKLKEVHKAYSIAGIEIDIVAVSLNGKIYCVDLVGYPGKYEVAVPLERWKMLERVGVRVFFLSYTRWYFEREQCVMALRDFLE